MDIIMDSNFLVPIALGWAALSTVLAIAGGKRFMSMRRKVGSLTLEAAEVRLRLTDLERILDDERRSGRALEASLRTEIERRPAAEQLAKRVVTLEADLRDLEGERNRAAESAAAARETAGRLEAELSAHMERATESETRLREISGDRDRLIRELGETKERAAATAATLTMERSSTEEKMSLLQVVKAEFSASFKSIAGDILEHHSTRFTQQNQESLSHLLNPLRERIKEFDEKVTTFYDNESRERFSLGSEVRRLSELHTRMSQETENLTKALKGSAKVQGTWGELVLDQVLAGSGLRSGHEYDVQPACEDSEGNRLQPDVVVHLPQGKHLVIDSKVSLAAYERCVRAVDEAEQRRELSEHLESIHRHVKNLAGKRYHELYGISSPDFVLMFVPVESAFMLAMKEEPELMISSLRQNVLLVCPSTLLATLRLIASIWRYEHQNRNAQEIARLAGRLYDKFVGFVIDFSEIGKRLSSAQVAYEAAHGKLAVGRGNLVRASEGIKKLGVMPSKALPQSVAEIAGDDDVDVGTCELVSAPAASEAASP